MDKFQAMNAFVAVVEAGSFVGACDATGLSKPVISRQISGLEQALGVRLLHRTTRSLSLTNEGRAYYLRCKDVLAAIQDAEAEAGMRASQAHGRLRVGAPQDFGTQYLASLWGPFLARNPELELDISLSDRVIDLVEEGFDMVVRIGRLPDSVLVSRKLASSRMLLCAAPAYLAAHGTPNHPSELSGHEIISYAYSSFGDEWTFTHAQGERVRARVQPRVHVNSGVTCTAMAVSGQGVVLQPDFLTHEAIRAGTLVELMPAWQAGSIDAHVLYPTRTLLPLKVQLLRDFLVEAFRDPPWDLDH